MRFPRRGFSRASRALEREALRILSNMIAGGDMQPLPTPERTARFSAELSLEMQDRVELFAAQLEDYEEDEAEAAEAVALAGPAGSTASRPAALPARDAALLSVRLMPGVLSGAELLRRQEIAAGAREALDLLHAMPRPRSLPQLTPRGPAEIIALRVEHRTPRPRPVVRHFPARPAGASTGRPSAAPLDEGADLVVS